MNIEDNKPVYSIAVAAELSGASPRMLREYEKAGFIKPARVNGQRRYSNNDIKYIKNILFYLEEVGMTITGLKLVYLTVPCWRIKQCGRTDCPAYGDHVEKCWSVMAERSPRWRWHCESCPVYLTHQKNSEMKTSQAPGSLPFFFHGE